MMREEVCNVTHMKCKLNSEWCFPLGLVNLSRRADFLKAEMCFRVSRTKMGPYGHGQFRMDLRLKACVHFGTRHDMTAAISL